jgi:pimeloyl-ACP methyl ester carboxylesterase
MWADVNGTRLHYQVEGDGLPCFVVSGAGSGFYQRSLPAGLRRHLRLIFVDLRGSGRSAPFPVARLTLEGLVDDLEQLRRTLGLERVAVLGHSMRAAVAVLYACAQPARTRPTRRTPSSSAPRRARCRGWWRHGGRTGPRRPRRSAGPSPGSGRRCWRPCGARRRPRR